MNSATYAERLRRRSDLEARVGQIASRLRSVMPGGQSATKTAAEIALTGYPDCGPYPQTQGDSFTAGGRIPAAGPTPVAGTTSAVDASGNPLPTCPEQYIFEYQVNSELCARGEKNLPLVATVSVRLSTSSEALAPVFGAPNTLSSQQADTATTNWTDAFLRIKYGSDNHGPIAVVDCDLMTGTSIPLLGGRASFYLVYPKVPEQQNIVQPLLDVSISIGTGSGQGQNLFGARRTVKVGDVGNGQDSATILPIPAFAVSASYVSNDASTAATLKMTPSAVAGAAVFAQGPLSKSQGAPLILKSASRGFVVNASQSALTASAVVFLLCPA